MASIRPLLTIVILAVVGAYLYVKINEGPAPSRAGANAANQSPEGVPPLASTKSATLAADSNPPAWPSAAADPPSSPASAAVAPAASLHSNDSASKKDAKDDLPAMPAIPELPPLPALSDIGSAATPPATSTSKDSPSTKGTSLAPAPLTTSTDPQASSIPPVLPPGSITPPVAPAGADAAAAVPPAQSSAQNSLRSSSPTATPTADPDDRYATGSTTATPPVAPPAMSAAAAVTPLSAATTPIGVAESSSFAASWPAIQAALDRHDLKQAHQLLSKWHGNETLNPTDTQKVETLLGQLAGTVIYSTEHQLEPARVVKPGETLDAIAKEYNVTPQLLAKINGIQNPDQLQPGQQLKVIRGPFSAVLDLSRNQLTLTLADCYAGKFHIASPPGATFADGQWVVDQKLPGAAPPASSSAYTTAPPPAEHVIVLRSATSAGGPATLVIASGAPIGFMANPPALRVSPQDAEEIADILSVGSRVTVRK